MYFTVIGKGNKERIVPFGHEVLEQLFVYLHYKKIHNVGSDYLLYSIRNMPMTINSIKILFYELKDKTFIKRLKPHLLRHTFATMYLVNGGDVFTLKNILGHTSLKMTEHYVTLRDQYIMIMSEHRSYVDKLII